MRLIVLSLSILVLASACAHGTPQARAQPSEPARAQPSEAARAPSSEPGLKVVTLPRPSPAPVVVMMELNPWLTVIGSDSAEFALYEDGKVIYLERDASGRPTGYKTALLSHEEKQQLLKELSLDRLTPLNPMYEADNGTDLPTTTIITWPGGTARSVSVYGILDRDQAGMVMGTTRFGGSPPPSEPPPPFVDIFKRLKAFRSPHAVEWTPETIEIMFWPYEHATSARPWPATWPDLKDAAAQPTEEKVGRIYVDGSALPALGAYFSGLAANQAVEMNGRKMAVNLRAVLPGEERWTDAVPPSH